MVCWLLKLQLPFSSDWPKLALSSLRVLDREDTQSINIPCWPQVPIVESSPVALGPRKIVTL